MVAVRIPSGLGRGDCVKIAEVKVAKTTCETTRRVPMPRGVVGAVVRGGDTGPAWEDERFADI